MLARIVNVTGRGTDTKVYLIKKNGIEEEITDYIYNTKIEINADDSTKATFYVIKTKCDILIEKYNFKIED